MKVFADLHLHSKYSRGCSKNLNLETINYYAFLKGLQLLATGDFLHPLWLKEIYKKLIPVNEGIFQLKDTQNSAYFILGGELSSIFSRNNKVYRIHYLIFLPDFNLVTKLYKKLSLYANLSSDGRPIIGLDVIEVMKIVFDIYEKTIFIPAHIWTPWFSLYGSMSGFNSIYDAFGDYTKYVTAVETGLSSDPAMNWRLSELDQISIVSFSDAHSYYPHRLGREATLFELVDLNYDNLYKALKLPTVDNKIIMTIEFFPEEGKYHYDGHRLCKVRFSPKESKKNNYLCPVCYKKLTIGVMSRVESLADRQENFVAEARPTFKRLSNIADILGQIFKTSPTSKKVLTQYEEIIKTFGKELDILMGNFDKHQMLKTYPELVKALEMIDRGDIILEAGYDGEYGKVLLDLNKEVNLNQSFKQLF
ncbi:MAG: helicase UvrD [Candidatus Parcubacteria bacterium]|nr:MAG: helicase UvrD [Candidatus Parcubacteria bacterium]